MRNLISFVTMPRDVLASLDVANVHKEILRCRCQEFAVMGERQGPKIKKTRFLIGPCYSRDSRR